MVCSTTVTSICSYINYYIDLDSYLPSAVLEWVVAVLQKHDLQLPTSWNDEHEKSYDILRMEVENHCAAGNSDPELSLLPKPVGVFNWAPVPVTNDTEAPVNLDLLKVEEENWEDVREGLINNEEEVHV